MNREPKEHTFFRFFLQILSSYLFNLIIFHICIIEKGLFRTSFNYLIFALFLDRGGRERERFNKGFSIIEERI